MQNDKQNLTKAQLAALDLLIAHMEENKGQPLSFIGSILSAVTDVATAVTTVTANAAAAVTKGATNAATNAVTDATNAATNAATNLARAVTFAIPSVVDAFTFAAPVVSALAQAVAVGAVANDPKALQAGGNPLQDLEKSMTLENLIKIRNQHTKK
jgi:hypothetical protein